ncbi:D-lactate dehydrogenase [Arthrobacter sp. JUb119]|uniref:FAD-binding and (Fe-S)-binding domain-containing protein n=1 Tax=Micrococcaceae TaxID=1268 RepID=UPI000FA4BD2C|nr:FAD-binding and (Fe-S)-binding domain-containing protein [Arthrobacter sp. JUb115]MCS3494710.1 D-lactate dehydrogenase [Arthrobacter sp. JUb119]TDU19211.1 D-lactate dehydrogenase [Arthrobacter sp. JUb115]
MALSTPALGETTVSSGILDLVGDQDRVKTRSIDRVAYASDASHYLYTPQAVVLAKDAAEVSALLAAAARGNQPVTLRSGGTSLAGQASGDGLMIDVRRNFRGITVLDNGARVRVQPGATVRQVNARLAVYGSKLGPDPASEAACTIGGVIANNSSGMACGTEFNTYRTLESMTFVLPSGTMIDTADPQADRKLAAAEPQLVATLDKLGQRVRSNPASVAKIEKHFALKNTMGYGINAFLDYDTPAELMAHLIIGSEGTLAFVAEAVFRTVPIRKLAIATLAVFDNLDLATRALPELVDSGAATLELMDSTSLRVGQSLPGVPDAIMGFDVDQQAALLVEYHADTEEELAGLRSAGQSLLDASALRAPAVLSPDAKNRQAAWKFRKGLYASVAGARATGTTALLEDVVVPVESLAETCDSLQELFTEYGYADSVIFGHAKDGNIHFMLTDRFEGDVALNRYNSFNDKMVQLILDKDGNLKAEHGTGRAMAPFVRAQYGDELYEVHLELKAACDPRLMMNPGVIIDEDHAAHIRNIKLNETIEIEADHCVECGYCEPVCPSKDLTLTPRQRIVVRRAIAKAEAEGNAELAAELERDYEYNGVQTCAVDGMCVTACPVGINTGLLVKRLRREDAHPVLEAGFKAAAKGWGPATRAGSLALSIADKFPASLVRGATDAARKVVSTDTMPRYDADLPGGGKARKPMAGNLGAAGTEPLAIYLPACVNSMFGPAGDGEGVAPAFTKLLHAAGVSVYVPEGIESTCCGTPWTSKGYEQGHEVMGQRVLEEVRAAMPGKDLPIISDASSCTEGFAHTLAEHGYEVVDLLAFTSQHLLEKLPALEKISSVTLHPTCSSTQMGLNPDMQKIAEAVADTVNTPVNWGCCGFAGDRGMLHPELTESATAREAAEVRELDAQEHASCNRTCELGMTRATGKEYRHIVELLADAASK